MKSKSARHDKRGSGFPAARRKFFTRRRSDAGAGHGLEQDRTGADVAAAVHVVADASGPRNLSLTSVPAVACPGISARTRPLPGQRAGLPRCPWSWLNLPAPVLDEPLCRFRVATDTLRAGFPACIQHVKPILHVMTGDWPRCFEEQEVRTRIKAKIKNKGRKEEWMHPTAFALYWLSRNQPRQRIPRGSRRRTAPAAAIHHA